MPRDVALLIIGAGPFGLAMAAYAQHLDIDYLVVGKPMDFWKSNMPKGLMGLGRRKPDKIDVLRMVSCCAPSRDRGAFFVHLPLAKPCPPAHPFGRTSGAIGQIFYWAGKLWIANGMALT